tara:strand:- start:66 stop:272 length:207 start_codon:yes stop_codon:yes gene_type:complete
MATPSSCSKLTSFGQRDRAVLLEVVMGCELSVEVEVVVNCGMRRGEFLQGFHVPKLRHRALSSPERLV